MRIHYISFFVIVLAFISCHQKAHRNMLNVPILDEVLQEDTIAFDNEFKLVQFLNLLESKTGSMSLRTLPQGDLEYYINLDSKTLESELEQIQEGKYWMLINYFNKNEKKAAIQKFIRQH